jgi:gamma-glutamyl-gamma-aminobutyrate hydrolase PuuD
MSKTPHVKSHYREAINKYGQKIQVPVIDVRDGVVERMMAKEMEKATNRSKYITYTEYHRSHKPKTNV